MVNPFDEEKEASNQSDKDGFIFHFGIHPSQDEINSGEPLVDFVRCQLRDLLKIIVLTHNGERVKVNGFRFLNDIEKEHKISVNK